MGFADDMSKRVRKALRLALNEVGREWVKYLRWKVGIWVVYHPGWVERSDPGEPPRRETSKLWKSFRYRVHQIDKTRIELEVYSDPERFPDRYYAWDLEYGNAHIEPRPFFHKTHRELRPQMKKWIERVFYRKLNELNRNAADGFNSADSADQSPEEP